MSVFVAPPFHDEESYYYRVDVKGKPYNIHLADDYRTANLVVFLIKLKVNKWLQTEK